MERTGKNGPPFSNALNAKATDRQMNVLIDLDGTLTDPRVGMVESIKYAMSRLGLPCPGDRELERYIGPPLQDTFAVLLNSRVPEDIESAIELYRERYAVTGLFENTVYPDIPMALRALKEMGASLFVATSKPEVFAERIIERFGLGEFFKAIHGSELDGTRTRKGDVIAHALTVGNLSAESTIMVGDRMHDIAGARENGLFSVGVLWGFGSREELVEAGASVLCEEPADLARVLSFNHAPRSTAGRRVH
jgi:phosphoglycolate phosphatase